MASFVFRPNPEFTWPVTVSVPQDGGVVVEQEFTARFRLIESKRLSEIAEAAIAAEPRASRQQVAGEIAILQEVVCGWDGVVVEDGSALPWSPLTAAALFDVPFIRNGFFRAYARASAGLAAEKNSAS